MYLGEIVPCPCAWNMSKLVGKIATPRLNYEML